MRARVVGLGALCDVLPEEDARRRLVGDDVAGPPPSPAGEPAPGRWVPPPGEPVLPPGSLHFRVAEFAVLDDGRRLVLHHERGFSLGGRGDLWAGLTTESLESDVLATVLPDDAERTGEDHPWDWLAVLLGAWGVDVAADDLRGLPYAVEFTDRLRDRLPGGT